MKKSDLEKLQSLKIMDDDFARLVFENKECGLEILKILGWLQSTNDVIHYETQKDMKNLDCRSLVFDIFVLTKREAINIEIENKISKAIPQRARLHASEMDVRMAMKRKKFMDLPKNLVVFICNFDYFKLGLPYYTIRRTVLESRQEFKDESTIIYINGEYAGDDELGRLIHDLKCTNPNDIYNDVLRTQVKQLKETKGGRSRVCKVWDDIRNEGRKQGRKQGRKLEKVKSLKLIMENLSFSVEEAMKVLKIPEKEWDMYRKLVLK